MRFITTSATTTEAAAPSTLDSTVENFEGSLSFQGVLLGTSFDSQVPNFSLDATVSDSQAETWVAVSRSHPIPPVRFVAMHSPIATSVPTQLLAGLGSSLHGLDAGVIWAFNGIIHDFATLSSVTSTFRSQGSTTGLLCGKRGHRPRVSPLRLASSRVDAFPVSTMARKRVVETFVCFIFTVAPLISQMAL